MKTAAVLLISVLLAACASAPPPPPVELFHDVSFAPPSVVIDPGEALAVSPAMRAYIAARLLKSSQLGDRKQRLIDALYHKGDLQLEYDAAFTRTAAQAFEARTGNCLALVMMTAAFAKELGLGVRYQAVLGDDPWDRIGDLYIAVGHVNLSLADRPRQIGADFADHGALTVDFLAPQGDRAPRTRELAERTIVAMFLNNRAVEALTGGRPDDAYWWVREALRTDPALSSAYVTLGVVYRQQRHPEWAEAALRRVSEREPDNIAALSNRILALRDLGRDAEADGLAQRLARLDPHPPFSYFHQGMAALRAGRMQAARDLFEKEAERAPYQHEVQFWLAVSYMELNDARHAIDHLKRAMEASTTRRDRDLYAAKLDRLKALAPQ